LIDAIDLYKFENQDKDFPMIHCFKKLEGCKKWDRVRRTLNDGKTSEEGPAPMALAVVGRPGGNKKAKPERNADSSIAGIDVSLNMFVYSMNANKKEIYERSNARWKEINEAQREKLALERERVQAANLEAEATLVKAKNDAKSFELTNMVEEAKNLIDAIGGHGCIDQVMVHDDS
jgi:hypothetical protein